MPRRALICIAFAICAFASRARAADSSKRFTIEFTTLGLMRAKGLINEAEYESALRDLAGSVGDKAEDSLTLVLARFSTTLYGFVETDFIWDSTQSFNETPGNTQVQRPTVFAGANGRFMLSVRNSRLGLRMRAPEFHRVRASAMFEMDFLGNQPAGITEAALFINPTFRARHINLEIETPIVDLLIGQYWELFGWQPLFFSTTVEIQGVPAQVFSRTPQLRISKTIKPGPLTLDFAVAMMRPPQRDSSTPEGQAGIRLAVNRWTGMQTVGASSTKISPMAIGFSAAVRRFSLPQFSAAPVSSVDKTGWGVSGALFVPIVPATEDKKGNSLSLTAEYAFGYGTADLYTALSGGVVFPPLPNPTTPNVDPALVVFAGDGTAHLINWQSALVGLQYYLPRLKGELWISANYSHLDSNNARLHGPASATRDSEDWADVNLFGDPFAGLRLGLEYAYFHDHYTDGVVGVNHRVQFSAFYLF